MDGKLYGLALLYLAIFLLALNGLFAKLIDLDAVSITVIRSAIAASAFLGLAGILKRPLRLGSFKKYIGVYALGAVMGVHWVSFYHSMQISTVAVGVLALFSYPIITILLEPFFSGKKLMKQDIFAGLAVFTGIAVMVNGGTGGAQGDVAGGVFWGVFSASLFSLRNLIQKYHYSSIPSESLIFHQVCAIMITILPFINIKNVSALPASGWLGLLLLGLFSTAAAHTLYAFSLKRLPAKSVALIGCVQPPISALMAWAVLGEVLGASVAVGGLLILSVTAYESVFRKTG